MAEDTNPYEADTKFTEREVIAAVLKLIQRNVDDTTYQLGAVEATVAAEWDRKGFPQHSPLDYQNPSYRSSPESDDLILTLEVRIDGYERHREETIKQLEAAVRTITKARQEQRLAAEIAEAAGAAATAKAALDAAERKLAELRAK